MSLGRVSLVASLAAVAFAACGGNVAVDSGNSSTVTTGVGGGVTTTGTGAGTTTTGTGASTTTTGTGANTTTTGTGANTTTTGTGANTTTTGIAGAGGGGGGFDCTQDPDCPTCCVNENQDGYFDYLSIVLKLCACGSPMMTCFETCSLPNENACSDAFSLGQACIDCINNEIDNGNDCANQAQNICQQQPLCSTVFDCLVTCP